MSLRFKREELKRLWLEDIKYKHMLQTIQAMWVKGRGEDVIGEGERDLLIFFAFQRGSS